MPLATTRLKRGVLADASLTKKASLTSAATALNAGARAIVGFVVNPILVRSLGDTTFGHWQVLYRLIGQTNPAGGRASEALKWFLANRQASADVDMKRGAVAAAIGVWLVFLPFLVAIGGAVAWFAPAWLDVPPSDVVQVRIAGAVLVAGIVVLGIANIPWAALTGQNLGYKRMGLTAAFEFLVGALMIVAAVAGSGLVGLAAATIVSTILSGGLYLWLCRRYIPWFGVTRPAWPATRRFLGLSWWFLLWNIVTRVTMSGDVVVLGIAGSAEQVTSYSLTRFIPLTITASVASLIFGVMPGLGGVIGAGEFDRAARIRTETMSVAWLFSVVAGGCVLLWERSFLGLWVDERFYPGTLATLLIVVMVMQLTLIRVDSNIIDLTLDLRTKVLVGLLASVLATTAGALLVGSFDLGIAGVAGGFIAGRLVQSVTYPLLLGRLLAIPVRVQLIAVARASAVTAAVFATCAGIGSSLDVRSWTGLVVAAGASAALLTVISVMGGLSKTHRGWMWSRVKLAVRAA